MHTIALYQVKSLEVTTRRKKLRKVALRFLNRKKLRNLAERFAKFRKVFGDFRKFDPI